MLIMFTRPRLSTAYAHKRHVTLCLKDCVDNAMKSYPRLYRNDNASSKIKSGTILKSTWNQKGPFLLPCAFFSVHIFPKTTKCIFIDFKRKLTSKRSFFKKNKL